jgi:hypothetical protein
MTVINIGIEAYNLGQRYNGLAKVAEKTEAKGLKPV